MVSNRIDTATSYKISNHTSRNGRFNNTRTCSRSVSKWGLGTIGAGYLSPDDLATSIKQVKALTSKPFAVNLFVPETFSNCFCQYTYVAFGNFKASRITFNLNSFQSSSITLDSILAVGSIYLSLKLSTFLYRQVQLVKVRFHIQDLLHNYY